MCVVMTSHNTSWPESTENLLEFCKIVSSSELQYNFAIMSVKVLTGPGTAAPLPCSLLDIITLP